jgi:hypothetical protein
MSQTLLGLEALRFRSGNAYSKMHKDLTQQNQCSAHAIRLQTLPGLEALYLRRGNANSGYT